MAFSNETKKTGPLACDGVSVDYAGTFYLINSAWITVLHTDADGVDTELSLSGPAEYSVTTTTFPTSSFNVRTVATYPDTDTITIVRLTPQTQTDEYGLQGPYDSEDHERNFDKVVCLVQELSEELDRCVKQSASDATALDDAQYLAACIAALAGAESAEAGAAQSAIDAAASAVLAEAAADAVAANMTVEYALPYSDGAGGLKQSSSIKTNASGDFVVNSLIYAKSASSGATAFPSATMIVETNTTNILQLLSTNTSVMGLMFGDPEDADAGYIRYAHSNNEMSFYTAATKRMTIDNLGNILIGPTTPSTSKLKVAGSTEVATADFRYTGDPDTNGSFRTGVVGGTYVVQERQGGTWVTVNGGGALSARAVVQVGDIGGGTTGALSITNGLNMTSATKTNPSITETTVAFVFASALPSADFMINVELNDTTPSNSRLMAPLVIAKSVNGFTIYISEDVSVALTQDIYMTVKIQNL